MQHFLEFPIERLVFRRGAGGCPRVVKLRCLSIRVRKNHLNGHFGKYSEGSLTRLDPLQEQQAEKWAILEFGGWSLNVCRSLPWNGYRCTILWSVRWGRIPAACLVFWI